MKVNKCTVAVFSGVTLYYLSKTIYMVCTTDNQALILSYFLLMLVTILFGTVFILEDYCQQLHRRYQELSKTMDEVISEVNLKFECVDENLDRLYINDVITSKRKETND